jgi:thioredoxin 1
MVTEVNDNSFSQEVLNSDRPVLVDFWAPWCMPCKMLAPSLEAIAEDHKAGLKVCKVNVDEAPLTSSSYGVSSIPTIVLFKNGEQVYRKTGLLSRNMLEEGVSANI